MHVDVDVDVIMQVIDDNDLSYDDHNMWMKMLVDHHLFLYY